LIDSDDQETASDFTILRNESQPDKPAYTCIKLTGAAVRTETLRLSTKYETIIIDTGGRDTTSQRAALSVANVLLVPFVPRSFDVWTLEKVGALVAEIRTINPDLLAYTFINRADPKGQDNDDAADVLKETDALTFIDAKLGMRKAFSNAAATGQGVAELKPSDSKAIAEMAMLFQCVFNVTPTLNKY
jgi:chromosome partitioning protein